MRRLQVIGKLPNNPYPVRHTIFRPDATALLSNDVRRALDQLCVGRYESAYLVEFENGSPLHVWRLECDLDVPTLIEDVLLASTGVVTARLPSWPDVLSLRA